MEQKAMSGTVNSRARNASEGTVRAPTTRASAGSVFFSALRLRIRTLCREMEFRMEKAEPKRRLSSTERVRLLRTWSDATRGAAPRGGEARASRGGVFRCMNMPTPRRDEKCEKERFLVREKEERMKDTRDESERLRCFELEPACVMRADDTFRCASMWWPLLLTITLPRSPCGVSLMLPSSMHLKREEDGQRRGDEGALSDGLGHLREGHRGTERVAVRYDRPAPRIEAVDLQLSRPLQQLTPIRVGGGDAGDLVAHQVGVVRARHPVVVERPVELDGTRSRRLDSAVVRRDEQPHELAIAEPSPRNVRLNLEGCGARTADVVLALLDSDETDKVAKRHALIGEETRVRPSVAAEHGLELRLTPQLLPQHMLRHQDVEFVHLFNALARGAHLQSVLKRLHQQRAPSPERLLAAVRAPVGAWGANDRPRRVEIGRFEEQRQLARAEEAALAADSLKDAAHPLRLGTRQRRPRGARHRNLEGCRPHLLRCACRERDGQQALDAKGTIEVDEYLAAYPNAPGRLRRLVVRSDTSDLVEADEVVAGPAKQQVCHVELHVTRQSIVRGRARSEDAGAINRAGLFAKRRQREGVEGGIRSPDNDGGALAAHRMPKGIPLIGFQLELAKHRLQKWILGRGRARKESKMQRTKLPVEHLHEVVHRYKYRRGARLEARPLARDEHAHEFKNGDTKTACHLAEAVARVRGQHGKGDDHKDEDRQPDPPASRTRAPLVPRRILVRAIAKRGHLDVGAFHALTAFIANQVLVDPDWRATQAELQRVVADLDVWWQLGSAHAHAVLTPRLVLRPERHWPSIVPVLTPCGVEQKDKEGAVVPTFGELVRHLEAVPVARGD
eukprot:3868813-Pleurochrysis_carterae.AAC.1